MARVVVVGAGVGGLCAAVRLGAAGHTVTVLEAAAEVGGKLGSYARDGFRFDTGPSLLTWPEVFADTFAAAGAALAEFVELAPVHPAFRYRFGDGTWLEVPNAPPRQVADALGDQLGGRAAADWLAFSAHAARVWQAVRGPFLSGPLNGPLDLVRYSRRLRDLAAIAPWRTLHGTGQRFLRDPRLRVLLDRYATYCGSDPRRAPAALAVVPWLEQSHGVWYVRGGLRRLADALTGLIEHQGGRVRTGAEVTAVRLDGGRAVGVTLAGGPPVAADVVVCNTDATALYTRLLPPAVAAGPLRRLRRATPSLSGLTLLLALRGRTPGLIHHTVLFPRDYDDEFDSIFAASPRPVPDPAVYVTNPDDPTVRPSAADEAWFVLVNAPRHDPGAGVDWNTPGLASSYADAVLTTLARRGLDVRDRVRWRVVRTPADLATTGAPGGSIYGTSSNGLRAAFLRPANRTPVPGLFLVGGSTHPGGGLPLVAQSARIVAGLVGPA